uniref:MAPK kinase substrate protein At1g80180 n=1 Tax=Erigeron canadensis TaxID=72917 RepID=UPI001CB92D65|nr:MAPK kinase substrate protein At1g80180 [Erigeron canadensis]
MAGLPRSDISFRRSGSSGLVWEDKLLSGELKPRNEVGREKNEPQRSAPKPYRTTDVAPAIDPPSPKVSGCCAIFGKATTTQKPKRRGHGKS